MANGLSTWGGFSGPGVLGGAGGLGMGMPGTGGFFGSPLAGNLGVGGLLGAATPLLGTTTTTPLLSTTTPAYWWGAPSGWTDLDLYDYNNNLVLDDEEIADIVADNIHLDPFIPMSDERNINIEVRNGVVTLSGTVRNPRVKPLAYADAFWSPGVIDVVDNLQVQPMQRRVGQQQQGALQQGGRQQGGRQQVQQASVAKTSHTRGLTR